MTSGRLEVAEEIRRVAAELPWALLQTLAGAIESTDPLTVGAARAAIQSAIPQPHYRAVALSLFEAWRSRASDVSPEGLAFALLAAGRCEEFARKNLRLALVWTGPDVEAVPPRRTEQALLQVIESAKSTLTVVSFVAYKVPHIASALAEAARRGVSVRLVLEDAEVSQGKVAFDALTAFGPEVAQHAAVYVWPMDQRPAGPAGQRGSLHAKCAVADANRLLISSANLTEHAFNLNIELGVLIRGGELPRRADSYWTSLIQSRTLVKVGS